jgi:uncharacterized protein YggE
MPRSLSTSIAPLLRDATLRRVGLGVALGMLVAVAFFGAVVPPRTQAVDIPVVGAAPPEHTISVSGTGRVTLAPDVADIRLGVMASRPTVKEARAVAAEAMTKILASLKSLGIADKDITTSTLSLQPVYDYSSKGSPSQITGYQLQNVVLVTIRDLDKVGPAIDGATAAGATTIDGITFRVDNPTAAERQARTAAMADARAKADALASAAGVSITGVSSVAETTAAQPYPVPYAAAGAARDSIATPIQSGTTEIDITVNVVYGIA